MRKSSGELVPESGIFVWIKTEYETRAQLQASSLEQNITCNRSGNISESDLVDTAEQSQDSHSIDSTSAAETQFHIRSQDEGSDREVQTLEVDVDVY